MNLATSMLEWDTDVVKHYVRRQAWLPAAIDQAESTRDSGREPKYLTFCAAEAIDIFLFLKEGVLTRDPNTDSVLNTYFCEKDPLVFSEISQKVGPHEQGFFGDFEDMILFEDDEDTRGLDFDDIHSRYSRDLRRRLSTKARHQRFRSAVPFDVMNLDVCGTFFPPRSGVLSPMLQSIRRLLDWQTESAKEDTRFDSFTLFLTSHVECGKVNDEAMNDLVTMIETNQATYAGFSQALERRFGTIDPHIIASNDFVGFYCIALPKVVISEAFQRGWQAQVRFSGLYQRSKRTARGAAPTTYSMLAWVGRFDRHRPDQLKLGLAQAPSDRDYSKLIATLTSKPEDVDYATGKVQNETKANLTRIVSYRDVYSAGIRSNA